MAALNLATGREGGAVPKTIALLGSALFFAVAPSSVAGLVPWWITHWEFRPPFFDLEATRAVGILLIVAGLPGLSTRLHALRCKDWARRRRSHRRRTSW